MKFKSVFGFGGMIVVALLAATLSSNTFAAQVQLLAADDTWVREDNSDSNRDGEPLNARTNITSDDNDVILLRFDVSSLTEPVNQYTSVDLTWFRNNSGNDSRTLTLWGINDASPDDIDWDETTVVYGDGTVTFPDAPGLISDQEGGDPLNTLNPQEEAGLGNTDDEIHDLDIANLTPLVVDQLQGAQVEGDTYSLSSAALGNFINNDTNGMVSFLITRNASDSSNQARFASKELTQLNTAPGNPLMPAFTGPAGFAGPFLTIIPEPSSAILLILAGMAMVSNRRSYR